MTPSLEHRVEQSLREVVLGLVRICRRRFLLRVANELPHRHLETRLAYFAIPRYVEFVSELPLTDSGKVSKYALRDRGVGTDTWDREAAGVELRR